MAQMENLVMNAVADGSLNSPNAIRAIALNKIPIKTSMIVSAIRISLAALGALAVYKFGFSLVAAMYVGGIVSLPAVAIAGGSWLLYHGVTACVATLAAGSFATLEIGAACGAIVGGWALLEYHDKIEFGLVEQKLLKPMVMSRMMNGAMNAYLEAVAAR
jgi:hypothetical protein